MLIRVRGKDAMRHISSGAFAAPIDYPDDVDRPRTRGDCEDGERPCPFVSCRHHLFLEVLDNGNIQTRADDVEALPETCSLDVADRGPQSLEVVASVIDRSRELVRQIQNTAEMRARRFKVEPLEDFRPEFRAR